MEKVIVTFSNGDDVGVSKKRYGQLVKSEALNLLAAEYIAPTLDKQGNEVEVYVVAVDGEPYPSKPAKEADIGE